MRTAGRSGAQIGRAGRVKQERRDERGVALVVAIGVMVVALALSLLVATIALRQNRSSAVDRSRAVAVNAAEAGVDVAFAAFQSAGPTLPCGPDAIPDLNAQVPIDEPQVTVDVQYFQADGVTPITDCAIVQANLAHSTMRALITATAQTTTFAGGSTRGERAMQAFVTIRPKIAEGFDNAIFADDSLTVKNNHIVYGNEGNDADIYTNGNISCPNGSNQTYQGSIYSQGNVTFTGQCSVVGSIWANGLVTIDHKQTTVGGDVISSTLSVSVKNPSKVTGTIMAGTTINPESCTAPECIRGLTQGPPPQQPFPQLPLSSIDDWSVSPPDGPGYQRVADYTGNCSDADQQMLAEATKGGTGRVIYTPCRVAFSQTKDVRMMNDLVIYADGGFSSSQQVTFTSGDDMPHLLYWIVPYGVSCAGDSGDIVTDNNFGLGALVDLMMYTPCDVSVQNHADHFGQIYGGGTVTIDNKFDMYFQPLPVYGIEPASLPLLSYDVDVIYKREVRP